ncbi:hypothetical protein IAT38_000558 [Cryptococcus sp. DSM 104549]
MGRLGEPSRAVHYPEEVVTSTQEAPINPDDSTATILSAELSTINSQLMSHGWAKKPLNLGALGQKDYNDVVAVLFELLGAGVSNLNTLDTLTGRHRTLEYEHERLQKTTKNLRNTNAKLETEVAGWKARCAEVEKRLQLEEAKTKELREEGVRGRKALETVRVAAGHETKKIQMKLDKALGQLTKANNDSSMAGRSQGLVLLNPIPAGRIQPVAATQSLLLEQTLRELSDIRESLQEETEAFRHVVVSTGNGLREALAAAYGQEAPARLLHSQFFTNPSTSNSRPLNTSSTHTLQFASSTSHPSIAHARIQQLIAQIRTRITEGVPKFSAGEVANDRSPEEVEEQKRVEREQEKKQRDLEDRVKDLEVELVCARKREEEASRLVEEYAAVQLQQGMRSEEHGQTMEKQRQALDEERRRYAEEAVKLGQERQRLEAERQAFLEEQRRVEMDAMLAILPVTTTEPDLPAPPADTTEPEEVPSVPSSSTWYDHRPHSPSPLSPQRPKNHTPRPHMAGRRKSMKTPLSRLVLEKAVRQKGRDLGVSAGLTKEPLGGSVLGAERGRRTNVGVSVPSPSRKGKEKAADQGHGPKSSTVRSSTLGKSRFSGGSAGSASSASSSSTMGVTPAPRPALGASSAAMGSTVRGSTMKASTLGISQQRKVDMNKVGGVGPKAAAKGKGVWR